MAGYADTRQMIIDTLMGRMAGTEIQPEDHQAFALQITDYIRSVELVAGNATPIGFADADTVPVQPDNGHAVYLSSVGGAQTVTFSNFIGQNGSPISVTSTANVIKLVTLLWNGQYWSSQVTSVNAVRDTTDGYLFMGVATPKTNPGTPDSKVFYLAESGTYPNFNQIVVEDKKLGILYYDTSWNVSTLNIEYGIETANKNLIAATTQQDIYRKAKNFGNVVYCKILQNTATIATDLYFLYKVNGGTSWIYTKLPMQAGQTKLYNVDGDITEILIHANNVSAAGTISIEIGYDIPAKMMTLEGVVNGLKTSKQDLLVSGTNVKTINGQSILGSGNLDMSSGIIVPSEERGYYIHSSGETKPMSINRLTECLNIPTANCTIKHFWEDPPHNYHALIFVDEKLNYVGFQSTGRDVSTTNGTYVWDINNVSVPANAKYLVVQSQRRDVEIKTTEMLLTGIPFVKTKEKQDLLISGTNIKTINGQSLLGSGNIAFASQNQNVLNGKKWVACGDSFTQGDYNGIISTDDYQFTDAPYYGKNKVYPFFIGRRNNMTIINEAISGSIMALSKAYVDDPTHVDIGSKYPFSYQRYMNVAQDADYITLWFGINDAALTYLGTINDTTNETFYGAWNVVLEYFIKNRPLAKIGIIVTNGSTDEYRQAVRDVAQKWGIPYLDMTKDAQVPPIFGRDASLGYSPIAENLRSTRFHVTTLIKCITANSDTSFTKTKWQNIFWVSGHDYSVGDYVVFENVPYKCITANSDTSFERTKWKMMLWVANESYVIGDIIIYNGTYYKCNTTNQDAQWTSSHWVSLSWKSGNSYNIGDIAAYVNSHPNVIAHEYESTFIENWLRSL